MANSLSPEIRAFLENLHSPGLNFIRALIIGRVQGVGFRPFVFRLATELNLGGTVGNSPRGVLIDLAGSGQKIQLFFHRFLREIPSLADLEGVELSSIPPFAVSSFTISPSGGNQPLATRVPPDLVVCPSCLEDISSPTNRRYQYPFTTCTSCGPRFSLMRDMPYDRSRTTMAQFPLCPLCQEEFENPADRRFHAQPMACPTCGPSIALWDQSARPLARGALALSEAGLILRKGNILAIKGLGGFQLLVRADFSPGVLELRRRKLRPTKPFAVMVASLKMAQELVEIDELAKTLLTSRENPIVLLPKRESCLVPELSPGTKLHGIFLPTTPFHHLLFQVIDFPVVATSGNQREEPITIEEEDAPIQLGKIADAYLVHNRPITHRVDDSVVRPIGAKAVTLRLSRGYAPLPLPGIEKMAQGGLIPPILAVGGHQKNALALWSGHQAILAHHIGDLDTPLTRRAFQDAVKELQRLYGFSPDLVACDLHPDYYPTRWAINQGISLIPVQHHHAHAVSCMAEHNLLGHKVLGLTWDGTGYGPDGTIWGGEILRATVADYERVGHLRPFPLPGGETSIRDIRRIAFGLLSQIITLEELGESREIQTRLGINAQEARLWAKMIRQNINTPWTSSMGRLFDGVAHLIMGLGPVSYEGEAAMDLEAGTDPQVMEKYEFPSRPTEDSLGNNLVQGDWGPLLLGLEKDRLAQVPMGHIAAKFHNTLAQWASDVVKAHPEREVVLSGGCFQNKLLTERTLAALANVGKQGFCHGKIPPNDGGLAVGQLAIAMAQWQKQQ